MREWWERGEREREKGERERWGDGEKREPRSTKVMASPGEPAGLCGCAGKSVAKDNVLCTGQWSLRQHRMEGSGSALASLRRAEQATGTLKLPFEP